MDPTQFTRMMLPHALAVSRQTGLDPRLVIAQSALETGYGRSAPNNNYFGIKSHGTGGARMATTEVVNGKPVRITDSFRTYGDPGQSAADYARFLQSNPRYKGVLAEGTLQGQIDAMGRSGYATDPNYAAKLSQIATGLPIDEGMMIGAETMAALGKGPQVNMPPNGQPSRGILGGGTTTSTMGAQMQPEMPRRPSIWDKIGGPLADPDKRARLAMALEGLTLNPNQGVIEGAKQGIEQRADARRINQTAAWLRSQGRDDLAQAVEGGMIGGGDAFAAMQVKPAEATALQKNVEWLVSLGIPQEKAIEMARGGTTVNVGGDGQPVPTLLGTSGLVAIPDATSPQGWRVEPAQGSPLAADAEAAARAREVQAGAKETSGGVIITAAQRAREAAKNPGATGIKGALLSYNPETQAAEVYRQVDVLKANAKIESITAMRAASPTGAALGAASDRDMQILGEKAGALDPKSPNFQRDLDDFELTMLQTIHGPEAGKAIYDQTRGGSQPSGVDELTDDDRKYLGLP